MIISIRQKRCTSSVLSVMATALCYFGMQICRNISGWKCGNKLHPIAKAIGRLPWILFLIVLLGLTIACLCQLQMCITYAHTHITPDSVKEAFDQNPTGICYYRSNGQPILTNHKMNEIAFAITGKALLNALEFYEMIQAQSIWKQSDGSVLRFSRKEFLLDGECCYELLADDITELYAKSEALRDNNQLLKSQNEHLIAYGKTIDETMRRQEILNTKKNIHDEMNRLLISTENAIKTGSEDEKIELRKTWQKNILLLCMEATNDKNNVLADLDALAKTIGMTIIYDQEPITEEPQTLKLLSLAVEEAMTNAAKHGGAKLLYVHLIENDQALTAVFTNDGKGPEGQVLEGGGLSGLRQQIEKAGGEMKITAKENFTLMITIPKGGKINVI